jgi:hypothetical protein
MRLYLTLLFFSLFVATANGQGFPWSDFKERSVKDVIAITTKAFRPDDSMFLATNILATRAEVTFTGKSRPMPESRKVFLRWWVGMLNYDPKDYADLYDTEYLYKEGNTEYWLPTERPITKYFDKELKPDDKMVLFLISAGAFRDKGAIDCVLLVEEYQLPQNLKKLPSQ